MQGKLHNIQVAMREIALSPTKFSNGKTEDNFPITVYDTSGSYTDPKINIDLKKGLPRLREKWILKRNDVSNSLILLRNIAENDCRIKILLTCVLSIYKPLKAKLGRNVSQLHYAKKESSLPKWNTLLFAKINKLIY